VAKGSESVVVRSRDMHQLTGDATLPLSLHPLKQEIEGLIVPKMKVLDNHPLAIPAVEVLSAIGI
jgi:hypothetical protein